MGERSPYWDTKLRASFIGATAHHGRGHFNRAVLEGVAFSIKDNFSLIENTVPIHEVRIVGGGGKSPLWRSIMANVLNRPILKYANDDSSYGSALLAGVGAGIFSSHEEAVEKGLHLKERVEPDAETAETGRRSRMRRMQPATKKLPAERPGAGPEDAEKHSALPQKRSI